MTGDAHKLAEDAREGLRMVAEGEERALTGWLKYGAALNLGRKLFTSPDGIEDDVGFGAWKRAHICYKLAQIPLRHDDIAAMWADREPENYLATRRAYPYIRTMRGLHAKWKEAQRPQPAAPKEVPTEDERRQLGNGDGT